MTDLDGLASRYTTGGGRLLKKPTLEYIARLEAAVRECDALREVARDSDYALTAIIDDQFDEPEVECSPFEDLCGHRLCEVSGCLKLKRDEARAALTQEPLQGGETLKKEG